MIPSLQTKHSGVVIPFQKNEMEPSRRLQTNYRPDCCEFTLTFNALPGASLPIVPGREDSCIAAVLVTRDILLLQF